MNLTMRLTLDGLIRALRTEADIAADEIVEAGSKSPPLRRFATPLPLKGGEEDPRVRDWRFLSPITDGGEVSSEARRRGGKTRGGPR